MVAMLLIVSCAIPAIHIYRSMYKQQSEMVRQYEVDHLVHLLYANIIEKMYLNQIPLEDVTAVPMTFGDSQIDSQLSKLGYACFFRLKSEGKKKGSEKEGGSQRLCHITLTIKDEANPKEKDRDYDYVVYVMGGPKKDEVEEEEAEDDSNRDQQNVIPGVTNGKNSQLNRSDHLKNQAEDK